MDCSTSRMAVPAWRIVSTAPSSCSTTTGLRPSESSSIRNSLGRVMVAMARASICCCPPERLPARSVRRSARVGNAAKAASIMSASFSPRRRPCQAAARRLSSTRRLGKMPAPPGTWAMPRRAISSGGRWVMSRPSKTMAPWSASTTPPTARRRVDLPAPFVPRSATISPAPTEMSMPGSTVTPSYPTSRARTASSGSLPSRRSTSIWARVRMEVHTFSTSLAIRLPAVATMSPPTAKMGTRMRRP